jgi:protein O-mannosyl-transferase
MPEVPRSPGWTRLAIACVIAVVTALAYQNAAPPVFVHDDALTVPPNLDRGWAALPRVFSEPAWEAANTSVSTYRPLLIGSFVAEGSLWRSAAPTRMHRTNVALHVAATVLVFGLLAETVGLAPATIAALLFGVHPIHTEIVDSVFNRSELLATIAVVAALWVLVRWRRRAPVAAWTCAALLYLVALLSRESAVTLPLLAFVVLTLMTDERARADDDGRGRRRDLAPLLTFVVPLAVYLALRHHALAIPRGSIARGMTVGAAPNATWATAAAEVVVTLRESARMIAWPYPLRCSYADLTTASDGGVPVALAVVVLLAVVAGAAYRRMPAVTAGIAFFVIALLPSTHLYAQPGTTELAAERYVYLPSVGAAIALAAACAAAFRRSQAGTLEVVGLATAAVLTVFLSSTVRRNQDWHSQEALWRADAMTAPHNGDAWMQLTTELLHQGRFADVLAACRDHLADSPDHAQFHNNCATGAMRVGQWNDAERLFRRAIALGAGSVGHANFARMLLKIGRVDDAGSEYRAAVEAEPNVAMRHVRQGEMLLALSPDQGDAARAEFRAALAIDPDFQPARDWLRRAGPG